VDGINFRSTGNFLGCRVKIVKANGIKICLGILILAVGLACLIHFATRPAPTTQSNFKELFSDLSIGVPEYKSINQFTHPADAIKGDYFTSDFSQTEIQFQHLASKLGVPEKQVLAPSGVSLITVNSKIDPKYPWGLSIKAEITNAPEKIFLVHLEGTEPYN
jgi:hypothetical protein